MEQKLKDFIADIGEANGWSVSFCDNGNSCTTVEFGMCSCTGEDFHFGIDCSDNDPNVFLKNLGDYYDGFDPEEEAMLWVGPDGHGKNGAPYHISDIIRGKEHCEESIYRLFLEFGGRAKELRKAATHKVKVQVTEYLQKIVEVDAVNGEDACRQVEEMVGGLEIVLTADDFTERDIEPYEEDEQLYKRNKSL